MSPDDASSSLRLASTPRRGAAATDRAAREVAAEGHLVRGHQRSAPGP